MPVKPGSPCSQPGCPARAVAHGRCAQHQRPNHWLDNRANAAARGYGSEWQRTRAAFLGSNRECELCGQPSQVAHHILPKDRGGTDEPSNLASLCKACHERIHGRKA